MGAGADRSQSPFINRDFQNLHLTGLTGVRIL